MKYCKKKNEGKIGFYQNDLLAFCFVIYHNNNGGKLPRYLLSIRHSLF